MTATLLLGLVVAALAWAGLFAVDRLGFWTRALLAGLVIAGYAVAADGRGLGHLFRQGRWPVEAGIGLAGAGVLYAVFAAGDRLLRRLLPTLAGEVDDLYRLRSGARPLTMTVVLCVVGPAEELFWRGYVQHRAGVGVALAAYAAVHLWERKVVLVLAAVAGGAFWGGLLAWRGGLVAPVVSHAVWDLAVVQWLPVATGGGGSRRGGGR